MRMLRTHIFNAYFDEITQLAMFIIRYWTIIKMVMHVILLLLLLITFQFHNRSPITVSFSLYPSLNILLFRSFCDPVNRSKLLFQLINICIECTKSIREGKNYSRSSVQESNNPISCPAHICFPLLAQSPIKCLIHNIQPSSRHLLCVCVVF